MSLLKPAETAYIALGSNLGDREGFLRQALARLNDMPGLALTCVSSAYETEPVGMPGAPRFLNAVAALQSEVEPEALLDACLRVEAGLGRVRGKALGLAHDRPRSSGHGGAASGVREVESSPSQD